MTNIVPIRRFPDHMPADAPLALPEQNLRVPFRDPGAPGCTKERSRWLWRLATFLPAIAATLMIVALFTDFFVMDGLSPFEALLISLIAFSFFWIALSVAMTAAGVIRAVLPARRPAGPVQPLDVAILIPVHDEVPEDVFGNAQAMLEDVAARRPEHRFSLFILSDTKNDAVAEAETHAFAALKAAAPSETPVHYRRFAENTDRKIGNIAQWVRRWGGGYEAMLVLDADSLMTAQAITDLADAMAADPGSGLIQSTPRLVSSETVLARVQQFATTVYGPLLSLGLAAWTGREGNYWGHNAIIRTRAFAACAGLPRIGRDGRLIMSHDFVEAALLCRAGWGVSMLPAGPGSYEEAPETLIDYVKRDARWCRGNLQHLRLIATRGLHPVSRFHLFQGAMSYLVSPVWLALLLVWAAIGVGEEKSLIVYFSGNDPRPHWPELTGAKQVAVLFLMYGLLLAPKLVGVLRAALEAPALRSFGGPVQFALSFLAEVLLSVAYSPILMIQQTRAVITGILGVEMGWSTYRGSAGRGPSLWQLLRFHAVETVIGAGLVTGIVLGFVTLWLSPIALSLAAAMPLSALSGLRLTAHPCVANLMATPEDIAPPPVLLRARAARDRIGAAMATGLGMAAE